MDSRGVVVAVLESWAVQDVERAIAHAAEDIVYALHISDQALPFGGETCGWDAFRNVLYTILADFDYLKYEPVILGVEEDVVRVRVSFAYRHRRTAETLTGTKRMVFKLRDSLVARIDEYHDAAMVEAFMRLTQQREADHEVVQPPELPRARAPATPQDIEEQK